MRLIMESLLALQALEYPQPKGESEAERKRLRKAVPAPVLGHYDRLLARGKKGVSVVRNGVCSECHIRVPMGNLLTLARGDDIQICGNCGRYLQLPESEIPGRAPEPGAKTARTPTRKSRTRRDAVLAAA